MRPLPTTLLLLSVLVSLGSVSAYALEGVDDGYLSDQVAQDGLTMKVFLPDVDGAGPGTDLGVRVGQTIWHDGNGAPLTSTSSAYPVPGAVIHGSGDASDYMSLTMAGGSYITIDIDSTGDVNSLVANAQPSLNIKVSIPAFQWRSGKVYAARSNGTASPISDQTGAFLGGTVTTVGGLDANIQLGGQDQGHLAIIRTTITGGVMMTGYSLNDLNSGGSLSIPAIAISDYGAAASDLRVNVGVDIKLNGLVATVAQLGDASNGFDVSMTGFKFGSAATSAIGGVDLVGVNIANTTVRITGH